MTTPAQTPAPGQWIDGKTLARSIVDEETAAIIRRTAKKVFHVYVSEDGSTFIDTPPAAAPAQEYVSAPPRKTTDVGHFDAAQSAGKKEGV